VPGITVDTLVQGALDAGVPPDGSGSHRLVVVGALGRLTDPDGFEWEAP